MTQRLVLVGAGHAHAQVLKSWAQTPRPEVDLVVVSPQALAPYSGMVPGWLSGVYRFNEIVIDFPGCASRLERAGSAPISKALIPSGRPSRLTTVSACGMTGCR